MTKNEFMDFLNWMLSLSLIDTTQYNDLLIKAMPYLKK